MKILSFIPVRLYVIAGFITLFLISLALQSCGTTRYRTTYKTHSNPGTNRTCISPGW